MKMKHDMFGRRALMAGLGVAGAAFALRPGSALAQTPFRPFQPARHQEDAWLNEVPGTHRSFIDAATVNGAGEAVLYANNLYVANKDGYGLAERDVAVVVCLRHFATAFAFNDAVWAKYAGIMSHLLGFTDPMTKQPATKNLLNSPDYGMALPSLGNTIPSVTARGTRFAVCDMATHFFAGQVAQASGGDAATVYKELVANRIPESHMVAAGVVAVNRAQEYGYTLLTAL
jgi:hypothetical protein